MATDPGEEEGTSSLRQERHDLLVSLKTTMEGLLATHSSNVWNTYGGLQRVCNDVQNILEHRMKVIQTQFGSILDFWYFIKGLRWLHPVMAPTLEQFSKMAANEPRMTPGQVWIKQSLIGHNLSSQLQILVQHTEHLEMHYEEGSFLRTPEYFQAMLTCLQAVEQNKAAMLADVSLQMMRRPQPKLRPQAPRRISHVRSASLPINTATQRSGSSDHLAARSGKTGSALDFTGEHALPDTSDSLSPEDHSAAKEALLSALEKSGGDPQDGATTDFLYAPLPTDPLQSLEFTNQEVASSESPPVNSVSIPKSPDRRSSLPVSTKMDQETANTRRTIKRSNTDVNIKEPDNTKLYTKNKKTNRGGSRTGVADELSRNKKYVHVRSMSDFGVGNKDGAAESEGEGAGAASSSQASSLSSSLPGGQAVKPSSSSQSLLEDGGSSIAQMTECYFPRPTQGQSLMSFLSSQDFHTCAELDKENAHFSISEALIAAIEQMKCNQILRPQYESENEGDSDEEIQELKQRIRIRRRERMKEKARGFPAFSDGKTDTATTSTSAHSSAQYETPPFTSDSSIESSEEDVQDREIDIQADSSVGDVKESNLTSLQEGGLSLSMASLYSDAELQKANERNSIERQSSITESSTSHMSAECVAISLLKKFSENQLPKASELEWLVPETDAPQALLPLPDSFPVAPDHCDEDSRSISKRTRIRGNFEWAPPRAQIIFNIHPPPKRKTILAKQNYRCAGCGMKVAPGFVRRFRYCEYLGKFFCQCCHNNATSYIPSRMLRKWDFTKYYVSNFARDLLLKMHNDPLFNVNDINNGLYRKVRVLDHVRECRVQLYHLKVFVQTCRNGLSMLTQLEKLPPHWLSDVNVYTMAELVQVYNGEMLPKLRGLVSDAVTHISQCQLCQAKGFVCELCNNGKDIIFPFELARVLQCDVCKACFHKNCFVPEKCPKCVRIELYKSRMSTSMQQYTSSESDSS